MVGALVGARMRHEGGHALDDCESFRVKLSNSGAAVARAGGVAEVLVRAGLARSTDERIKVELDRPSQKPVDDARARRDREEQGIVTWRIAVCRGGDARVGWRVVTGHLDGAELVETQRR